GAQNISGSGTDGTVTVTGAGSTLQSSSTLSVGEFGSGVLDVSAGATVTSGTGYLGRFINSQGTASVSGAGSSWTAHRHLTVGPSGGGSGTLTIADQALVYVDGFLGINIVSSVKLNGGTLRFSGINTAFTVLNRLEYNSGVIQLSGNRTLGGASGDLL